MVDDRNDSGDWVILSNAVGEALLDVERTFMTVVERRARKVEHSAHVPGCGGHVKAYFDAWSRLDGAHRVLSQFLASQGHPMQLAPLRCGDCPQDLR